MKLISKKLKHPKKLDTFQLRGISGEDIDQVYVIDKDEVTIKDELVIIRNNDLYLLRSLDKEFIIGGEYVMESILEPNDDIQTKYSEYRFEHIESSQTQFQQRIIFFGIILLVGVIILVIRPHIFSHAAEEENLFREVISAFKKPPKDVIIESPTPSIQDLPPEKPKILDDHDVRKLLGDARLRYQVAEDYAKESKYNVSFLYWAITQWERIINEIKYIKPEPPLLKKTQERLAQAKKELDHHINILKL